MKTQISDASSRLRHFTFMMIAAFCVLTNGIPAWGQSAGSTIHGTVRDEQGGAVPGVTVTLSSPALQVRQMSGVTQADGTYRFGELPAGTFRIVFELAGFKPYVVDELRLTIGFVARVDAQMIVGALEESIVVTGASPIVDMTSTATSVNLTSETIQSAPIGRSLLQVFAMTPGVTTSRIDVGDDGVGQRFGPQNYGTIVNSNIEVDGIDISDGNSSGVYLTSVTLAEVQIRTSGNDAEVSVPGVSMIAVIKSGSNQFHGTYNIAGQRPELQSSNLTDSLRAQGLSSTVPLRHLFDLSADLGGRILRDKLWFYTAFARQDRLSGITGFAAGPGPDGRYLTGDDVAGDVRNRLTHGAFKLSYQPRTQNRLIAAWQPTLKYQPQGLDPGRFRPLEATLDYRNPSSMYKGEFQSTLSSKGIVWNVVAGNGRLKADYAPWRSRFARPSEPGNPSRFNRETGLNTGAHPFTQLQYRDKWQIDGSVSVFPEEFLGGSHELKAGTTLYWNMDQFGTRNHPAGNYTLVFDRLGGVPDQPAEIQIRNSPTSPGKDNRVNQYAAYVKDTWRVTNRVTANLGIRFQHQRAFVPPQSKEASADFPTLFPAAEYPPIDLLTWQSVDPRLGLAVDVAAKTVIKATFGIFSNGMGSANFADAYNPLSNSTMTFRWRDLNGNRDYDVGEVNLDPSGRDLVSIAGVSTIQLNRDLKQPMTTEATVSFEREMAQNLAIRALYVFKKIGNQYATTNVARPRGAYNIPITRRDPGPDGALNTADDGGTITIFDYDPAFRGAAFVSNELRNSDRDDHFQTIEFTMTKRLAQRWGAIASFWATKNHAWLRRLPDDPNDDLNVLDQTWEWAGNFSGSYSLPWDVQLGAFVQSRIGVQGQRTNIFRAIDPDGGPRLNQLSTVTLRLEPFGTRTNPAINVVNFRVSKAFSLLGSHRAEVDLDLFNVLNSSAPLRVEFRSGPTFGYVTSVLPPRIARLGFRYSF